MANWTNEQLSSFLLFTDNQDMDAINKAIAVTPSTNPQATALKDSWIRWWDNLSWYERNIDTPTYDEARNRRNAFFLANAPQEQKEAVEHVIQSGMTTEEQEGHTKRADSTGHFPQEDAPLIPTQYKIVAIATGAGVGVLVLLKKLHII